MSERSLRKAISVFCKLTIQNGHHLPLLKIAKNIKQTISHDQMGLTKYISDWCCHGVLKVKVESRCNVAFPGISFGTLRLRFDPSGKHWQIGLLLDTTKLHILSLTISFNTSKTLTDIVFCYYQLLLKGIGKNSLHSVLINNGCQLLLS